jgi:hypothetical protein
MLKDRRGASCSERAQRNRLELGSRTPEEIVECVLRHCSARARVTWRSSGDNRTRRGSMWFEISGDSTAGLMPGLLLSARKGRERGCFVHAHLPPSRRFQSVPPSLKLLEVGETRRDFQVGGSGGHLPQLAELLQEEIYRNHYREGVRVYAWSRSPKGESLCVPRGSV